jgi:hypothetical protein
MSDMLLVARALLMDSRTSQQRWSEWSEAEVAAFELRRQRRLARRPFSAMFALGPRAKSAG